MLAINAPTGVEFGSGFHAPAMRGRQYHDQITKKEYEKIVTSTNNGEGTQGGISTGMPIYGRVAFRPTLSIRIPQNTVDIEGNAASISTEGRHDACVLPRAVPAVEAMAALAIADLRLRKRLDRIT